MDITISHRITPEHPLVMAQQGGATERATTATIFQEVAAKVAERLPAQ